MPSDGRHAHLDLMSPQGLASQPPEGPDYISWSAVLCHSSSPGMCAACQAAEPALAPGAVVVADNAGIFAEGGLRGYLEYVRSSPRYQSRFVASTLEWRDDIPDGLEVSVFTGVDDA